NHRSKRSVVTIAVEGPIIAALEIIDAGLVRLPTSGCAKNQRWPGHVDEGFTVVVPVCVEHTEGLMLLTVANKIAYVDEGAVQVGPDHLPFSCSRLDNLSQACNGRWINEIFVAWF